MDETFKKFFLGLAQADREVYAKRAGSSVGYLLQIAYGNKGVELGMADAMVAAAGGALKLDHLPLTDRAREQRRIRGEEHEPLPKKDSVRADEKAVQPAA